MQENLEFSWRTKVLCLGQFYRQNEKGTGTKRERETHTEREKEKDFSSANELQSSIKKLYVQPTCYQCLCIHESTASITNSVVKAPQDTRTEQCRSNRLVPVEAIHT